MLREPGTEISDEHVLVCVSLLVCGQVCRLVCVCVCAGWRGRSVDTGELKQSYTYMNQCGGLGNTSLYNVLIPVFQLIY